MSDLNHAAHIVGADTEEAVRGPQNRGLQAGVLLATVSDALMTEVQRSREHAAQEQERSERQKVRALQLQDLQQRLERQQRQPQRPQDQERWRRLQGKDVRSLPADQVREGLLAAARWSGQDPAAKRVLETALRQLVLEAEKAQARQSRSEISRRYEEQAAKAVPLSQYQGPGREILEAIKRGERPPNSVKAAQRLAAPHSIQEAARRGRENAQAATKPATHSAAVTSRTVTHQGTRSADAERE